MATGRLSLARVLREEKAKKPTARIQIGRSCKQLRAHWVSLADLLGALDHLVPSRSQKHVATTKPDRLFLEWWRSGELSVRDDGGTAGKWGGLGLGVGSC